jgi:shikimate dehydrogenase
MPGIQQLAVLGSPIAHSKSPALHAAAYAALGLEWSYEAIEMTGDALPAFVDSRGPEWRGLSLTMPLKRDVLPLLTSMDEFAELTGGANTILFDGQARRGFNTDVFGAIEAFRAAGVESLDRVRVLGGGATAASLLVAVARLGATSVAVAVRSPGRIGALVALCELLGLELTVETLGAPETDWTPDAVVSTLPNGTEYVAGPIAGAVLFDVAYEPWPTAIASAWLKAGERVIPGIQMLAWQALAQVRIFVNRGMFDELPNEASVFAAMLRSVEPGA